MLSLAPADADGVRRDGAPLPRALLPQGSTPPAREGPGGSMAGPGWDRGHRRAHWPPAFGSYYPWTLIGQEPLAPSP